MYKQLFRNVLLPLYSNVINRDGFPGYLREYRQNQRLSGERIASLQLEKLNRLLAHAWNTVPYLKARWTAAGLTPAPLRSLDEYNRYPVLTKAEISSNYDEMISLPWRGKSINKTTSGSTGAPFRLEYTRENDARRRAVMWRGYGWSGAELGARCAYLWGADRSLPFFKLLKMDLYDRSYNRRIFNCFEMTQDNLGEFARGFRRAKPEFVVSYVNPIVTLSRWALENGVKLSGPKAVLTGAEALAGAQREVIERAFEAPVFNTYGCREVMLIAAECSLHRLHWNADHLVVEALNDRNEDISGVPGRVALTDLHNYAMPFVRYLNGDVIVKSAETCICGLGLPLLDRVEGRILDAIRSADGHLLPGEFFPHFFKDVEFVREFQIVQRSLDSIEVNLVMRGELTPDRVALMQSGIARTLGPSTRINFNVVEELPRTASGKLRVTVSMLAPHT